MDSGYGNHRWPVEVYLDADLDGDIDLFINNYRHIAISSSVRATVPTELVAFSSRVVRQRSVNTTYGHGIGSAGAT